MSKLETAITEQLKSLMMPGIRHAFAAEAERARRENLSFEQYLLSLLEAEAQSRRQNRIERLMRESGLPLGKSMPSFDRSRLPRKVNQQVSVLMQGDFVDRRENVLAFGHPGSGKTHLVSAIAQSLIEQGRRVLFTPCCHLVQDLLRAKRDLRLEKTLRRLRLHEVVVLDDIGYVQHDREEMEVLFAFLADRYERASVMLTSNLPFSKWEAIFKDPMTTAAAIDRLVHHSVILELNVTSYRLESAGKRKGGAAAGAPAVEMPS